MPRALVVIDVNTGVVTHRADADLVGGQRQVPVRIGLVIGRIIFQRVAEIAVQCPDIYRLELVEAGAGRFSRQLFEDLLIAEYLQIFIQTLRRTE